MGVQIDTVAGDANAFAVSPEVEETDGTKYTIRLLFRWLPRVERWACMPTTVDTREPLALEQHVVANARLLLDVRVPSVPPGRFVWVGEDPYPRDALGDTLRLLYLTAAEVANG
jgi:hypothetical protein